MLTVRQAADRLGVSETRVRVMAADGVLAATKSGRQWLVYEWAVDQRLGGCVKAGRPRAEEAPVAERADVALAHDLYMQCERAFSHATDPEFLLRFQDKDEREFVACLANFFLAKRTRGLVDQGVF